MHEPRYGTVLSALMAHPDALWRVGRGEEFRTTAELLQHLDAGTLDERIVRVDECFYRLERQSHEASQPLLTLVDAWMSDQSLANALQHSRDGLWLDRRGVAWTADQLLDLLTLEQLATPIEAESPPISDGVCTAVRVEDGSVLFVHVGIEYELGPAVEGMREANGSWPSQPIREAQDWELPLWPSSSDAFPQATLNARHASLLFPS